jgi:hypothetical protein
MATIVTPELLARFKREICAGEDVEVEAIGSTFYVYGSELATLRIFAYYNARGAAPNPRVRQGFSYNRNTWYFSLERAS